MRIAPPPVATVIRGAPLALGALAVPVAGFAAAAFRRCSSDEECGEREQEADRRAAIVRDVITSLEKAEADQGRRGSRVPVSEAATELPPQGQLDERPGKEEGERAGSSAVRPSDGGDDDDEDVDQIEFHTLAVKCQELARVRPSAPELKPGLLWCGKLLLKELCTAVRKTELQKDIRYTDGGKLKSLLDCSKVLDALAKDARQRVPSQLQVEIRAACKNGWRVQRRQVWKDLVKAVKMVCLVKEALPWVTASNIMSTLATATSTLSLHYRAEVMQSLTKPAGSRSRFHQATMAMLLVELVAAVSRTLETQISAHVDKVMARSIQVRLFTAYMSKDMVWWGQQKAGYDNILKVLRLPSAIQGAVDMPRSFINAFTSVAIQAALVRAKSSSMLYIMIALHWARFLLRKGLAFASETLYTRVTRSLVSPSEDKYTWVHAINPEYVQLYQSFARGPREAKDLVAYMHARTQHQELSEAVNAIIDPVSAAINQFGNIAEYKSLGSLVESSAMDPTAAETVMSYASQVGQHMESTYRQASSARNRLVPLAQAYDCITMPLKIDPTAGINPGRRALGHFRFEQVRFKYPGKQAEVLDGVTFEAKSGQVVGITGPSGCGKSTCLRLVERFYDVSGGRVLLDGCDIREYEPQWLRSQIVAVAQEPKLLPLSIRDNLTFGCSHQPSMQEIEEACRAANIWETLCDVQKFPNGLETKMSVVQNVAGGEKQRLCIARAILADPPILLLDEATSALDEESQAHVQEALNRLMKGRTTFVVAHRLSTIRKSDIIIGMEAGKVVDRGTHEELLSKPDGVWKRLWEKQAFDKSPHAKAEDSPKPHIPEIPELPCDASSAQQRLEELRKALSELLATRGPELQRLQVMIDKLEAELGSRQHGRSSQSTPRSSGNGASLEGTTECSSAPCVDDLSLSRQSSASSLEGSDSVSS